MKKNSEKLITAKDGDNVFPSFKSEKERIKYMSRAYANMSLAKSMSVYYGTPISNEVKSNHSINTVINLELGEIYCGTVKEFNERYMSFDIPGVKDEIISKEPLWQSYQNIQNFLLSHDNKLLFEVRQKENGKFIVSVINAYYRRWNERITKAANGDEYINDSADNIAEQLREGDAGQSLTERPGADDGVYIADTAHCKDVQCVDKNGDDRADDKSKGQIALCVFKLGVY